MAFLHIDRRGGSEVETDPRFLTAILAHMERFRLMGHDLEIRGPVHVPLQIELFVCATPRTIRTELEARLQRSLGSGVLDDGSPAFFNPDRWTFGQALELSALIDAVMTVQGVGSVEVSGCVRLGKLPAGERQAGRVVAGPLEILRCDNDPNFPENGTMTIRVEGGI